MAGGSEWDRRNPAQNQQWLGWPTNSATVTCIKATNLWSKMDGISRKVLHFAGGLWCMLHLPFKSAQKTTCFKSSPFKQTLLVLLKVVISEICLEPSSYWSIVLIHSSSQILNIWLSISQLEIRFLPAIMHPLHALLKLGALLFE